jgi:hypothetical protein
MPRVDKSSRDVGLRIQRRAIADAKSENAFGHESCRSEQPGFCHLVHKSTDRIRSPLTLGGQATGFAQDDGSCMTLNLCAPIRWSRALTRSHQFQPMTRRKSAQSKRIVGMRLVHALSATPCQLGCEAKKHLPQGLLSGEATCPMRQDGGVRRLLCG